ncbi:MAG: hypothetical protein GY855_03920 [candidate division Zixibacteria bacterium]|nr:hypothetical protein [candidate division Zixibacteria bacterium]
MEEEHGVESGSSNELNDSAQLELLIGSTSLLNDQCSYNDNYDIIGEITDGQHSQFAETTT